MADDTQAKTTETKADDFTTAAANAKPTAPEGSTVGVSPERARTGLADKGLSQYNPAIVNGGPVPDSRPGIDDSAAVKAAQSAESSEETPAPQPETAPEAV